MDEEAKNQSPNEKLAEIIVNDLVGEGLIDEAKSEQVLERLNSGAAKSEDWKFWLEKPVEQQTATDQERSRNEGE